MYSTRFFVISAVLFILQAIPSTTSHGIPIPLIKREMSSLDELANGIKRPVTKLRRGMAAYQTNTDNETSAKRDGVPFAELYRYFDATNGLKGFFGLRMEIREELFTLALATTGGDTVVASSECKTVNCADHKKYEPNEQRGSGPLKLEYAGPGKTVTVKRYTETLVLFDTQDKIEARDQMFGAAISYPPAFAKDKFAPDGMLGIGPPKSSKISQSLFITLAHQHTLPKPWLCLKLGGDPPVAYFGAADPDMTGEITWIEFSEKQEYWSLHLAKIEVNELEVLVGQLATFDLLHPAIRGDFGSIIRIIEKIPNFHWIDRPTGFASVPCESEIEFKFTVNGREIVIVFDDLLLGEVIDDPRYCYIGLGVNIGLPGGTWLLGYAFLQGLNALFDLTPTLPRFGYVPL